MSGQTLTVFSGLDFVSLVFFSTVFEVIIHYRESLFSII